MTRALPRHWNRVVGLVAMASVLGAAGCGRGLLGISSSEIHDAGVEVADPSVVPAGVSVCFPDHPANCDETCKQATQVIWTNCARCHAAGLASLGAPPFDFILDPQRLTTETWPKQGQPAERFVLPGDPDNSAIYRRAVVRQDMPPIYNNIAFPNLPRVPASDGQILYAWIASCLGAEPAFDAGSSVQPGSDASSVPSASDGSTFGGSVAPCPSAPPSGSCAIETQLCEYSTASCLCANGTWACAACPAAQPTGAAICTVQGSLPNGQRLPLNCLYGNISCACESDSFTATWGCGVCPGARPANGAACGNSQFQCSYRDDTCACSDNRWTCQSPVCPYSSPDVTPQCSGHYACLYPSDQSCVCDGTAWRCSCPSAAPIEGGSCLRIGPAACNYGDRSATCDGYWHYVDACPTTRPVDGTACHSTLSCSYGAGLCYCAGDVWHCS